MDLIRQFRVRLLEPSTRNLCGRPVWFKGQIACSDDGDAAAWVATLLQLAVDWIGAEPLKLAAHHHADRTQLAVLCRFPDGQAATVAVGTVPDESQQYILCDALGQHGALYLDQASLAAGWVLQPLPAAACPVGRRWAERVWEGR